MIPFRCWIASVVAGVALAVAGCGYGLRGTLPDDIRTVGVPIFTNRTPQPAIEAVVTRAILDAFATQGRLRVTRPEVADAILEGEIVAYDVVSIAFVAPRRSSVRTRARSSANANGLTR